MLVVSGGGDPHAPDHPTHRGHATIKAAEGLILWFRLLLTRVVCDGMV